MPISVSYNPCPPAVSYVAVIFQNRTQKNHLVMSKRASTRNVVLSKAMKHVDEETRREFREKRLQALESDNYVEGEVAQVDDDAYAESDVSRLFNSVRRTVRSFISYISPLSEQDEGAAQKRKKAKGNAKNNTNIKSKW